MQDFAVRIGKTSVLCNDYPGFIVNRLAVPMWNEAMFLVMEGVSPEDVDTALTLGTNMAMGPLATADFAGLDTVLATMSRPVGGISGSQIPPLPASGKNGGVRQPGPQDRTGLLCI